jgi:hypothetical protein
VWGPDAKSKTFIETPLPSLTVMFLLAGFMCILLGIQAEVIMRVYYESQAKTTYLLGEVRQGATIGQCEAASDGNASEPMHAGSKEA